MTADELRTIVRRIHEAAETRGELDLVDSLYWPDFVDERHPDRGHGPRGIREHIERLRAAFPDLNVTIDDLIVEGDRVVARVTTRGTHRGEFAGFAPTGAAIAWSGIVIRRVVAGKIVEQWSQHDIGALVRQLNGAARPSGVESS